MDLLTEEEMEAIKENNRQLENDGNFIPLDQNLKDMMKLAIKKGKAFGNCTPYRGRKYGGFLVLSEGCARALVKSNQIKSNMSSFIPSQTERAEIINHLKKLKLDYEGVPVTEALYFATLDLFPPAAISGGAFLAGDPFDYKSTTEVLYDLFYRDESGFYYFKLCTLNLFNQLFPL
jgi:hypothetical protein